MEKLIEVLRRTLEMGGYAIYVWPSFLITALAMFGMVFVTMRSLKKAQKTLAGLQASAPLPHVADL